MYLWKSNNGSVYDKRIKLDYILTTLGEIHKSELMKMPSKEIQYKPQKSILKWNRRKKELGFYTQYFFLTILAQILNCI